MSMLQLTVGQQMMLEHITMALEGIREALEIKQVAAIKPDEKCMTYEEWSSRLDFEQRNKLMQFLWNHPDWHDTCIREEDL